MWSEQHQPVNVSELAVHRKKVQEVEEWLKWALDDARRSSREVRRPLTAYAPPNIAAKVAYTIVNSYMCVSLG